MRRVDADIRKLAVERKQTAVLILIDQRACDPPGNELYYTGPLAVAETEELLAMLERWIAEKRA